MSELTNSVFLQAANSFCFDRTHRRAKLLQKTKPFRPFAKHTPDSGPLRGQSRKHSGFTGWIFCPILLCSSKKRLHRQASTCGRKALADYFQCLLLDCDGVLWQGDQNIDGSALAVQALKQAGKQLVLVTNSSTKSRASLAARATNVLGIDVGVEEVVTSGAVVAAEAVAQKVKTAYVVGSQGLKEELQLAGIQVLDPDVPEPFDENLFRLLTTIPTPEAVIVGHDESFSFSKLATASLFLQRGGEACLFFGTNPDVGNRDKSGYLIPEAGAILAAIEAASGRSAVITGKPSTILINQLLQQRGLTKQQVMMVGDRLDTDIAFGNNGGISTCLVLTGVSSRTQVDAAHDALRPQHVCNSLHDIVFG